MKIKQKYIPSVVVIVLIVIVISVGIIKFIPKLKPYNWEDVTLNLDENNWKIDNFSELKELPTSKANTFTKSGGAVISSRNSDISITISLSDTQIPLTEALWFRTPLNDSSIVDKSDLLSEFNKLGELNLLCLKTSNNNTCRFFTAKFPYLNVQGFDASKKLFENSFSLKEFKYSKLELTIQNQKDMTNENINDGLKLLNDFLNSN